MRASEKTAVSPVSSPIQPPDGAEAAQEGGSQAVKAQQRLRELILAGHLPAGSRIAELALVARLGMSRTPIRAALLRLGEEGLLQALPGGGYAVRTFSEREVADAMTALAADGSQAALLLVAAYATAFGAADAR